MSTAAYSYVCDHCGALTSEAEAIPEWAEWTCDRCGSHQAWEFTDAHHAAEHGARIQGAWRSGIFRSAGDRFKR